MTNDHDGVRELLAAWAVGALPPADAGAVPRHLAGCESCAAEAERLRTTVRLLDGAPGDARDGGARVGGARVGAGPAGQGRGGQMRAGERGGDADGVLASALRGRRPRTPDLAPHARPYAAAVAGLHALVRELPGRWGTPVVHDWDAHATVAHLVAADEHLAVALGIGARLPASRIPAGTPAARAWELRTADAIAHEHARTPEETVATWAAQAADLLATPEARDPGAAARAATVMGLGLPVADHFVIRAFEAWIHTDDIGRALGIAVPPPPAEHLEQLVRLAVRILGLALHDAPPVLVEVTGTAHGTGWVLGADAEPVAAELTLDPVDFCLLVGGRYAPDEVPRGLAGDERAARNVLAAAASLAWL
ncbi:maleylpyruvate isomerase family mycothiol-dependent enzyme [Streptomyces heilongjiangensis]|uniref:Maleylpyruvate isomerase family mycothiol-dependent enzyme n=1 Tax=Streptomyces heilongjiangensis TaxID=945052 RepID=A0ABW1B264_9ACTN|nr:maleylpyruvate isomerase family mycothiol-dependent enzyme [Streptomyces heilongjiangensis]MDC2948211.1 maleylpyruvate isomerase family mycothiol-dependent enzyme [Streptomyces heilongjiangensis]